MLRHTGVAIHEKLQFSRLNFASIYVSVNYTNVIYIYIHIYIYINVCVCVCVILIEAFFKNVVRNYSYGLQE